MYIYLQNFHSPIRTRLLRDREVPLLASHNLAPHTQCQSLAQLHPHSSSPQCHPLAHAAHPRLRHGSNSAWYCYSISLRLSSAGIMSTRLYIDRQIFLSSRATTESYEILTERRPLTQTLRKKVVISA